MKRILPALIILLFLACNKNNSHPKSLINYLPNDSGLIIESPDLPRFLTKLKKQDFIKKNAKTLKFDWSRQLEVLNDLDSIKEAVISISKGSGSGFAFTLYSEKPFIFKSRDTSGFSFEENRLKPIKYKGQLLNTARFKGIYLLSNSASQLKKIINAETYLKDTGFEKVYSASAKEKTSLFISQDFSGDALAQFFPALIPKKRKLANWTGFDLDIEKTAISFNGIAVSSANQRTLEKLLEHTGGGSSEIATVTPATSGGFYSLCYKNPDSLLKHLQWFNKDENDAFEAIIKNSSEIGQLYSPSKSMVINSINPEIILDQLTPSSEHIEDYQGAEIFKLRDSKIWKSLSPVFGSVKADLFLQLDHFLVFSESLEDLKEITQSYQTNSTLIKEEYYTEAANSLYNESSVLIIGNFPEYGKIIAGSFSKKEDKNMNSLEAGDYKITALQLVEEHNFVQLHGSFRKAAATKKTNRKISQVADVHLDAPVATKPLFFKNHLTDQMDIVVQDEKNQLYLISNRGNIDWKKQLQSRIQGPVYQVDLFRNGNIQLAFSTQNKIHVLDRNGNTVKPFPLEFNDPITQPLAIFDYDNNRKYRFVVTQHRQLYMFDSKGRRVKGFDFNKTKSDISQAPEHIRIGTKDYIVVPETSGKLHILNRQGNTRIPVKENFEFSENPWFEYLGDFISTNSEGELVKINENGKVSRENLGLNENNKIDATVKSLVTLSENILNIKGNEVALDFGLYTEPKIFYINDTIYVSVTDLQAEKVYLFNSNGQLLPNFPVYGTSAIDLNNADIDRDVEFVVKGDENEIILYKI